MKILYYVYCNIEFKMKMRIILTIYKINNKIKMEKVFYRIKNTLL